MAQVKDDVWDVNGIPIEPEGTTDLSDPRSENRGMFVPDRGYANHAWEKEFIPRRDDGSNKANRDRT